MQRTGFQGTSPSKVVRTRPRTAYGGRFLAGGATGGRRQPPSPLAHSSSSIGAAVSRRRPRVRPSSAQRRRPSSERRRHDTHTPRPRSQRTSPSSSAAAVPVSVHANFSTSSASSLSSPGPTMTTPSQRRVAAKWRPRQTPEQERAQLRREALHAQQRRARDRAAAITLKRRHLEAVSRGLQLVASDRDAFATAWQGADHMDSEQTAHLLSVHRHTKGAPPTTPTATTAQKSMAESLAADHPLPSSSQASPSSPPTSANHAPPPPTPVRVIPRPQAQPRQTTVTRTGHVSAVDEVSLLGAAPAPVPAHKATAGAPTVDVTLIPAAFHEAVDEALFRVDMAAKHAITFVTQQAAASSDASTSVWRRVEFPPVQWDAQGSSKAAIDKVRHVVDRMLACLQPVDATQELMPSLKRVKQEFKVYAMGLHELARQVHAVSKHQGQLMANLVYRCSTMFHALPKLFSRVLQAQREAIAKQQKLLRRVTQANEDEMNAKLASLVDFVSSQAYRQGSTAAEVVGMWRQKQQADLEKRATYIAKSVVGRLRRKALQTKLSETKESYQSKVVELQEALQQEKTRSRTLQEQVDQIGVLRQQCMELTMSLDKERNAVRSRETDIDRLRVELRRLRSQVTQLTAAGTRPATASSHGEESADVVALQRRVEEVEKERDELAAVVSRMEGEAADDMSTSQADVDGDAGSDIASRHSGTAHGNEEMPPSSPSSRSSATQRPRLTKGVMQAAVAAAPDSDSPSPRPGERGRRTGRGGTRSVSPESGGSSGRASPGVLVRSPSGRLRKGKRGKQKRRHRDPLTDRAPHLAGGARFPFELLGRERHERGFVCRVTPQATSPSARRVGFRQECAFARWVGWDASLASETLASFGPGFRKLFKPISVRQWGKGSQSLAASVETTGSPHDLDITNAPLLAVRRTIAEVYLAKRAADKQADSASVDRLPLPHFVYGWLLREFGDRATAHKQGVVLVTLLAEMRSSDAAVDLFAQFLEGSLDTSQLHFALALEEALELVPFGVRYPSPDPEFEMPSDWVCTTRATMVAREYCTAFRFEVHPSAAEAAEPGDGGDSDDWEGLVAASPIGPSVERSAVPGAPGLQRVSTPYARATGFSPKLPWRRGRRKGVQLTANVLARRIAAMSEIGPRASEAGLTRVGGLNFGRYEVPHEQRVGLPNSGPGALAGVKCVPRAAFLRMMVLEYGKQRLRRWQRAHLAWQHKLAEVRSAEEEEAGDGAGGGAGAGAGAAVDGRNGGRARGRRSTSKLPKRKHLLRAEVYDVVREVCDAAAPRSDVELDKLYTQACWHSSPSVPGVEWSGFATAAYELALFEDDFSTPRSLADHYAMTATEATTALAQCATLSQVVAPLVSQLSSLFGPSHRAVHEITALQHEVATLLQDAKPVPRPSQGTTGAKNPGSRASKKRAAEVAAMPLVGEQAHSAVCATKLADLVAALLHHSLAAVRYRHVGNSLTALPTTLPPSDAASKTLLPRRLARRSGGGSSRSLVRQASLTARHPQRETTASLTTSQREDIVVDFARSDVLTALLQALQQLINFLTSRQQHNSAAEH